MRWLPLVVALSALLDCRSNQTVYRCTACFADQPTECKTYEGDCYGPASNSMSASSMEEARELAAQLLCMAHETGGPPEPRCRLGISFGAADRRAALTHFTFTCSSDQKSCP